MKAAFNFRWIPPGYTKLETPADLPVEIYIADGYAIAYSGKRNKNDFHSRYRTNERRDEHIAEYLKNMREIQERKADRKATRLAEPNNLQVGDILHYSWGWEQTNCDFFQVIRKTAKTVDIQEIGGQAIEGSHQSHGMACRLKPEPGKFLDKAEIKGKRVYDNLVRMDHGNATKCAPDQDFYCSWYA